jgi:hypothetical protein
MRVANTISELKKGRVPPTLFYKLAEEQDTIDWSKLQYNSRYKSPEYFKSKLPKGYEQIPGFNEIIQEIAEKAISPLEEMDMRRREFNNDSIIDEPKQKQQ